MMFFQAEDITVVFVNIFENENEDFDLNVSKMSRLLSRIKSDKRSILF